MSNLYREYLDKHLSSIHDTAFLEQWKYEPMLVFLRLRKIQVQLGWANLKEWRD